MRLKIGSLFAGVFLLFFGITSLIIYSRMKTILVNNEHQRLYDRAELLAERTGISPLLVPLPAGNERFVIWYDHYGDDRELYRSPGFEAQLTKEKLPYIKEEGEYQTLWTSYNEEDSGGQIIIALQFTDSTLLKDVRELLFLLIISLAASTMVSVALGYYAAGLLIMPIRNIIKKTKLINAQDLTQLLQVEPTGDEQEELAKTINEMLTRIESSMKMQNNFFASASHELRTPLSILQTEFEVEIQNPEINPVTKAILTNQLEEVRSLSRLVEDFLLLSQMRANALRLKKERFDLDDCVLVVAERLSMAVDRAGLFLELQFQEKEDFELVADKDKIVHVIFNLVENAIKYAPERSTVSILLRKIQGQITLTVANEIIGSISGTEHLKEEFYRGNVTQNGYGLGLWISNKIIEAHDFKLEFDIKPNQFVVVISFDGGQVTR